MKFKIDESLPAEAADVLRRAGFIADTVGDEHLSGANDETVATTSRSDNRILVTLDLDFANIRAYPPGEHAGIIVLRLKHQDKPADFSIGVHPRSSAAMGTDGCSLTRRSASGTSSRNPVKHALHANIFVDVGPVYARTTADDLESGALLWSCLRQAP